MAKDNKKTLFIGLDGATWKIINPLIEEGKLPNLEKLMKNGSHGILMSDEKMVSPSVWTTIMTGKTAPKHGILDFMTLQNKLKAKRIWEIFEDYGKTVGVAGFLMTWPPRLKNEGFLIPDHFAPDNVTIPDDVSFIRELTNIRHLRHQITPSKMFSFFSKSLKYNISLNVLFSSFYQFLIKKIKDVGYLDAFHKEVNLFMFFLEKVFNTLVSSYQTDFSAIYLAGTDVVAHKYWNFFKPEDFDDVDPTLVKKYKNVIPDVYINSDKIIGRILKTYEKRFPNFDVIVVSDHGFQTCREGKFRPNAKIAFLLNKFEMNEKFNYTKIGHRTIVTPVAQSVEEEKTFIEQLKSRIESINTTDQNIPIFETELIENYVKISAQPRWKGYKFDDKIQLNGEVLKVDDVLDKGVLITGMHEREGIFIMSGNNIKKGHYITGAEVYDITPTLLTLNNMPVAKDMDGKVLEQIFEDQKLPIEYIDSYGEPNEINFTEKELEIVKDGEDMLEARLKNLGYM